jgi:hypothetical protein
MDAKIRTNMKQINKEEMFGNLKSFLKSKGIEVQEGAYAQRIRQGCELLTDSINVSQRTLKSAKSAMDQLRQTIHEQTAPKSPAAEGAPQKKRPVNATGAAGQSSAAQRKSGQPGRRARKG